MPEGTLRAYYEALRQGEPLGPFFADREGVVKVGIGERLVGHNAVVAGLREQSRSTTDWVVESQDRRVQRRGPVAWFADRGRLAWTDTDSDTRHSFETRWSGTLERDGEDWRFVGMHVSAPHDLRSGDPDG